MQKGYFLESIVQRWEDRDGEEAEIPVWVTQGHSDD